MENNTKFHITIKPKKPKLSLKKLKEKKSSKDILPAHVGTIFKSKDEVSE